MTGVLSEPGRIRPTLDVRLANLDADGFAELERRRDVEDIRFRANDGQRGRAAWIWPDVLAGTAGERGSGGAGTAPYVQVILARAEHAKSARLVERNYRSRTGGASVTGLVGDSIDWYGPHGRPVFENPAGRYILEHASAIFPRPEVWVSRTILTGLQSVGARNTQDHLAEDQLLVGPYFVRVDNSHVDAIELSHLNGAHSIVRHWQAGLDAFELETYDCLRRSGLDIDTARNAARLVAIS